MKLKATNSLSFPASPIAEKSVVALMSGGVDSTVAAWLLKKEGWNVAGVTMTIPGPAPSKAVSDGAAAALALGIPHYIAPVEEAFRERIMAPFVEGYCRGETPNPCAECNAAMKFGLLWELAEEAFGETRLTTGHYARVREYGDGFALSRGADLAKDQSYFLYGIKRERLGRLLLPLGDKTKEEVRSLAAAASLPTAEKRESMEICFVPGKDYRPLLKGRPSRPGLIVDEEGNTLGEHGGVTGFTIGQRKGLGISSAEGLYVLKIDGENNRVVVGPRGRAFRRTVAARSVNVLLPGSARPGALLSGKTRSRGEPAPLTLVRCEEDLLVRFVEPQFAPAPGQRLVVYDGDGRVVCGGIIRPWTEDEGVD